MSQVCPRRDELTSYLSGELDRDRADFVAAHRGSCRQCHDVLTELESAGRRQAARDVEPPLPTGPFSLGAVQAARQQLGRTLDNAGRYQILVLIEEGGMGAVYKAFDPELKRTVAVKRPRRDASPELVERFRREMRMAAQVKHENVCEILDTVEADGVPHAVMPFLEGSLAGLLARGPMTIRQAVEMARKVALGLRAIHGRGIVHRDLKPGNVLLDEKGEPKVSDFGLAREVDETKPLTRQGVVVGTPQYLAPEQALSQGGRPGAAVDVYSLGVMLYQMLTGRLPFTGTAFEILKKANEEDPAAPSRLRPEIDAGLEAIVLRAMARQPERRHQTAKELAEALEGWLASQGEAARASPVPAGMVRHEGALATTDLHPLPRRQRPVLLLAAAGLAVVAVVILGLWAMGKPGPKSGHGDDDQKEEALAPKHGAFGPAPLVMRPAKIEGVRRWTIAPRRAVEGEGGNHHSVAWSPNGKKLAVGGDADSSFCTVRDAVTGAVELRLEKVRLPPDSNPWCVTDKKTVLALVRASGELALFDAEGAQAGRFHGNKGRVRLIAATANGEFVAWADGAKKARISRTYTTHSGVDLDNPATNVAAFVWIEGGHLLAMQGQGEGRIRIFNRYNQKGKDEASFPAGRLLAWAPNSAGSELLATQDAGFVLRLVHWKEGTVLHSLAGHEAKVTSVSWKTVEGRFASVDERGSLRLWQVQNEKSTPTPLPHAGAPWVFSPDGQRLACCANNAVYFASGRDGSPIGVSMLLDDDRKYVTITADGHYAGSPGIDDDLLYVVETDGGQQTLTPAEFARKYNWKNDPKRVKLVEFPE